MCMGVGGWVGVGLSVSVGVGVGVGKTACNHDAVRATLMVFCQKGTNIKVRLITRSVFAPVPGFHKKRPTTDVAIFFSPNSVPASLPPWLLPFLPAQFISLNNMFLDLEFTLCHYVHCALYPEGVDAHACVGVGVRTCEDAYTPCRRPRARTPTHTTRSRLAPHPSNSRYHESFHFIVGSV